MAFVVTVLIRTAMLTELAALGGRSKLLSPEPMSLPVTASKTFVTILTFKGTKLLFGTFKVTSMLFPFA